MNLQVMCWSEFTVQHYFVKINEAGASWETSWKPWGFALDRQTYNNKDIKIKEDDEFSLYKTKGVNLQHSRVISVYCYSIFSIAGGQILKLWLWFLIYNKVNTYMSKTLYFCRYSRGGIFTCHNSQMAPIFLIPTKMKKFQKNPKAVFSWTLAMMLFR